MSWGGMEEEGELMFFSFSIVGKGNHSPNHIQKIKPRVELVCRELGLQYATEANAGRIYINLQGGQAVMPDHLKAHNGGGYHPDYHHGPQQGQQHYQDGYQQQQQQQQYHGGGGGGGQQQQQYHHGGGGGGQQQDPNAELKAELRRELPGILRALQKNCCVVM